MGQEVLSARDGDLDADKRVTARDLAILTYSLGATAQSAMVGPAGSPRAVVAHDAPSSPGRRGVLRGSRTDRATDKTFSIADDDGGNRGIVARTPLVTRTTRHTNRRSSD
jgi:hypothetical protein